MANDVNPKPSFSTGLKWKAALQVLVTTVCVAAVVVMVNYLAGHYFVRFQLSKQTRATLSPRSLSLVKSITNQVNITLFYKRDDPLYSTILTLLKEYHLNNPKISVRTVDYARDPAEAEKVKLQYNLQTSVLETKGKNWIIFDCEGRRQIIPGDGLADYTYEQKQNSTNDLDFSRKLIGFKGEMAFTAMLFAVTNPKPLIAYFLQGNGEADPADVKEDAGYGKFTAIVQQQYVQARLLSLAGTNPVPSDCNLLIIAGPTIPLSEEQQTKISQYLTEGGRLFALFNVYSMNQTNGLEKIVAGWGVDAGKYILADPENTSGGADVFVKDFASHPVVNSLIGQQLQFVYPRSISAIDARIKVAEAPKVEEIAFTGPHALAMKDANKAARRFSVMAAVEKNSVQGVVNQRGATRILVVGDSLFLNNRIIESPAHRDFASYAINWLLDRTVLLEGIGPRSVTEYRVIMSNNQKQTVQWILLGAMPGGVLLLGGLVWLRRRK